MSIEFALGFLDSPFSAGDPSRPLSARPPHLIEAPPAYPTAGEIARVVRELFTEGTLSAEQMRSLSRDPELEDFLDPSIFEK